MSLNSLSQGRFKESRNLKIQDHCYSPASVISFIGAVTAMKESGVSNLCAHVNLFIIIMYNKTKIDKLKIILIENII